MSRLRTDRHTCEVSAIILWKKELAIPGIYTTHYSVRVVFGPSRVRVGQKLLSSNRVSSTRWTLLTGRPT